MGVATTAAIFELPLTARVGMLVDPNVLFAASAREAARASILPSSSSMPNVQTTSAATSRKPRPITAVLYSGGSNGVEQRKVDNAVLNVARAATRPPVLVILLK